MSRHFRNEVSPLALGTVDNAEFVRGDEKPMEGVDREDGRMLFVDGLGIGGDQVLMRESALWSPLKKPLPDG